MQISRLSLSNKNCFVLFGGINVIENASATMRAAEQFVKVTTELRIPLVFKASFDKANRSSISSFRGVGIDAGLKILEAVKSEFSVPIVTDVHEAQQVGAVSEVADVLQVPAFLARQTDLVIAVSKSGKPINIKKPQFMSPNQVANVISKCEEAGNTRIILCERGSCFGYDNLIVDMLGFQVMKEASKDAPIIFDVTHSLQHRDPAARSSGGRRHQILGLARAGMATGLAGLFLEAHEDPDSALCDGPCALPLASLKAFLQQIKAVDDVVKSLPTLEIS